MSSLPEGWVATPIEHVTSRAAQRQPQPEEEFLYIDISSINRETKRVVSPQRLVGNKAPSRARQVVKTGDVLVSMTRPNMNAVALVSKELDGQIASTGFDVLRPVETESRWLFYLVRSSEFVASMSDLVQGALYPAVRPRDIRGFEIPLAPIKEQKRIADKLDAVLARVDACRDRLDRIPVILKRFRQSILAAATSGKLTEDWRTDQQTCARAQDLIAEIQEAQQAANIRVRGGAIFPSLSDLPDEVCLPDTWVVTGYDAMAAPVVNALKAGPFGSALKKNIYVAGGYKIYGQEQVIAGDESLGDYFIDEQKYEELSSCAVTSGDILISLVGTIGRVLILSDRCAAGIINPRLVKLSLYPSLNREFVSLYLQGPLAQNFFKAKSHGGTMDILNLGILRELPILLPPITEQTEIVRRVETLFAYADRLEARYTAARAQVEKLSPATLAKAFRGELVPQDPNDEPASMLLERIRTQLCDQPTNKQKRSRKVAA